MRHAGQTDQLKIYQIKKGKKWDRYKYTKRREDYDLYRESLEKFNEAKEEAIRNFKANVIAKKKTNPKRYYRYVAQKDKYCQTKITLQDEGKIITVEKECANIFNDFFSSVFTRDTSNPSIEEDENDIPTIRDLEITEEMVQEEIFKLNVHKSTGPDGIPPAVLKENVAIFAPILTKIFNLSYEQSYIPKILKSAHVVPLHKAGDKTLANNYRPVSLTPVISKLFEHIIKASVDQHVSINNIMSRYQHGFRKSKSTATNLLEFWNEVTENVEKSISMSIFYTDLRKAFDSVSHALLIKKLKRYGIVGKTIRWIEEFLNNRTQQVILGGQL